MLLIGIVLFLIGSILSGLSQTMWQLIAFRGVQGLGAGALFPISLAVIGDLFTPAERGKYQGLFGAVFGVAFLVGPFLGGVLTDNVGWHWIFFVNVPVGLISLYLIGRLLPGHAKGPPVHAGHPGRCHLRRRHRAGPGRPDARRDQRLDRQVRPGLVRRRPGLHWWLSSWSSGRPRIR
jgi:MFS family permease